MNRIIILVIFLSFTTSLQAQSVESDELFSKGVELYNLKRYNEAISYFNKSNNIDKALLDTTNSRRYYSEMWLSSCYMQLGKIKEAQAISPDYYMVPPIDRRLTVESDRFSELSNMFAQAGNLERALEYALRCADIEKQVAGKEHIWYGNSTIIIGNLYYALGDSINAEENYLINKNICKHTYGEYSERYVDALLSLASVNTDFSMKDGLDKATRYLDEAYSIAHKRYPLLEAQIVNQQSVIAFRNKNYEQAKTLMMQALSLCELAEGKTSNNYEILLSNTIDLYQMFGQYDEAITLGQDFLEACNQANRSDSIPAFIMVKISQANIAKGDINNALVQIEKAENIMRQYGTAKVDYINILGIMSTIYSNAGNKQKAISLNSKVLEFYMKKKDRVIEQQRVAHQAELERQEKKIIELEKEQLEADLRFKSKELSSVVMMNIAHQEFLNSLKEEIQKQKLSGQHSRKNLDKLLALVNNNIVSDEESWIMFQANFDRIHENFFRNLKLQYTDLTSGDLRFCALLRLNMPTKEIAKLLNISTRGVDAARYRLRKKFNLLPEESLTDFLINFK